MADVTNVSTKRFVYVKSSSNPGWEKGSWNEGTYTKSTLEEKYINSIVFIEKTNEIYTHGQYFGLSADDAARITDLETAVAALEQAQASTYAFKKIKGVSDKPQFEATAGAETLVFGGNGTVDVAVTATGVYVTGSETTNIVAPSASATAAAVSSTGAFINTIDTLNGTSRVTSSIQLAGTGAVNVSADASGNITIDAPIATGVTAAGSINVNGTDVVIKDFDTLATKGDKTELEGLISAAQSAADAAQEAADNAQASADDAQAAADTAQETADSKVAGVTGENAIEVDNTDTTNPVVKLKIATGEGKAGNVVLTQNADGLKASVSLDAQKVSMVTNSDDSYAGSYSFYQGGETPENLIGTINIAKDMVVSDGEVITYSASDTLPTGVTEAGTYIVLTLANADSKKIYVKATDLIEYVTSGSQTGDQVVVTVDPSTHKVTAAITAGTITETELSESVNASLDLADSSIQSLTIAGHALSNSATEITTDQLKSDLGLSGDTGLEKKVSDLESDLSTLTENNDNKLNDVTKADGSFITVTDTSNDTSKSVELDVTTATIASQATEGATDGLVKASDAYSVTNGLDTRLAQLELEWAWEEI